MHIAYIIDDTHDVCLHYGKMHPKHETFFFVDKKAYA